jgi:SAM-dependent methyltransferase
MPRKPNHLPGTGIRGEYDRHGSDGYYRRYGRTYRNPHEPIVHDSILSAVRQWKPDLARVLDLAAGSGEATLALREAGAGLIDGIDPYTFEAYFNRTGQTAERVSFDQIAAGALAERRYRLIVCSFALHLCQASRLPRLASQLSLIAPALWVLTPHKRPELRPEWGWRLMDESLVDRVRTRLYHSMGPLDEKGKQPRGASL